MSFSITRHITNILKVGPRAAWHQMMTLGEVKAGTLVGTDQFGNQYYESSDELWVRDRWVVPKNRKFDPSEIPPQWHIWIHKIDSRTPQQLSDELPKHKWMAPHTANTSGSIANYKVYDTTEPKVESWIPKVKPRNV